MSTSKLNILHKVKKVKNTTGYAAADEPDKKKRRISIYLNVVYMRTVEWYSELRLGITYVRVWSVVD